LGHQDLTTTQIYTHVTTHHLSVLLRAHHPLSGEAVADAAAPAQDPPPPTPSAK
jgi:hypothetical protein